MNPATKKAKRLDLRTLEIRDDLEARYNRELRRLLSEGGDPDLAAAIMAEVAMEKADALAGKILDDPEGWVQ